MIDIRENDKYPKVLVISNNCFSKSNSNGRTMANFFKYWKKEKLAQFYIQDDNPDFDICDNYFRVTDSEVIKSLIDRKSLVKNTVNNQEFRKSCSGQIKKTHKRTPTTCLIRDIVWNLRRWRKKEFNLWLKNFSPEVVVIQIGDSSFMSKLAVDIANERKIPLIIYNSEDYYFKKNNYFKSSRFPIVYQVFRYKLRKQFEKTMKYASHCIYNTETLQKTYNRYFNHKSTVIMTSSFITPNFEKKIRDSIKISYLGNLGVGRHESLIKIADALGNLNKGITLDVYGEIPNKNVKLLFDNCKNINYKGLVSYDEVVNIMYSSDLLIHAENFNEFYVNDLKHAFSTKIADSLSCGTCLILYAPKEIACSKYINKYECAYFIGSEDEIEFKLANIINNKDLRNIYVEKALKTAKLKHNIKENSEIFKNIIEETVKEWK